MPWYVTKPWQVHGHGVVHLSCGNSHAHGDVSLCCLLFAWYVSGGRCRFRIAVTRVSVYVGLNFQSINAVKAVEQSNQPKCFSGLRTWLCNAGASPDVAQRSKCQGMPWGRCGSMRSMNSRGIVSKSKHEQCIARRAATVHRAHWPASIDAHWCAHMIVLIARRY